MKRTRVIMGMPITVSVVDAQVTESDIASIFDYFASVERIFSLDKKESEIARFNNGQLTKKQLSVDVRHILQLAEDTKKETYGYFNSKHNSILDPSVIVKGWAIYNAATLLKEHGFHNFFVDAGGDRQTAGKNEKGNRWTFGIRDPFRHEKIVKTVALHNNGIATSELDDGSIYNPRRPEQPLTDIASMTVICSTVYDATRFATAAFAMGENGIHFLEKMPGCHGHMIDSKGIETETSLFYKFVIQDDASA